MERREALMFIFLFYFLGGSLCQGSIPARYDGFPYGVESGIGSKIFVEAFFDPLCPDSRDSWPPLKKILSEYYPHIFFVVHPFPLPYHDNSFVACRALHTANKLNVSAIYPLLELFFKNQEKYYNGPTRNKSRASIVDDIARLGAQAVGSSPSLFKYAFGDPSSDSAARVSFKYGCTRGVFGAPFFFVNGFLLPDAGSPLDYKTWKGIIDPLLEENHGKGMKEAVTSL
ncbi:hypothetical protein HPP92_025203 [Vanilla planifolia]|uniref:Thioredoxin-like fold domain-containing protein n=1 Tax=Vanilla planifolia TaxID=51239 RepID=A0A835PLG5_VANPL|nr:hypothetical protein HPP92_025203 [Vanilla planifolia]